ncbi:translation initiation protein sua5 [Colletotrichum truncatum]|uniref:Translation initiation protein sua5 n=1 Tax=Colletotrichum truncatum TaxID=5467 RepID=A0ACC3Z4P9_COLTU|nr:translation initiation protein sua5 [Colletotrichum truncatum]KAF6788633.1 translation initiation protein sua5 [Colletotrichum truncatum]
METRIIKVGAQGLGSFKKDIGPERLSTWEINPSASGNSIAALRDAAEYMRTKPTPVAFPTETVYGLGADATRSDAVKGIYSAKGRPSDNPLISHVCDLDMLRGLLQPGSENRINGVAGGKDPIPEIYKSLIEKFWPGPLTILLKNPTPSKLAPEVTAGLTSFGVRMPSSPLALTLIKLANVPLAAPSANASTKPSPTTAQHVFHDLEGRIELILDGGACQVGVESTVVDGLCDPPVVLRPGGVSMEELRSCPGWEGVIKGYKDESETGKSAPRAPGMKYKHYSPKAKVVLYEHACEAGAEGIVAEDLQKALIQQNGDATATNGDGAASVRIGIIRTRRWKSAGGLHHGVLHVSKVHVDGAAEANARDETSYEVHEGELQDAEDRAMATVLDIDLGDDIRGIAQGLFSALRDLDRRGANVIFVDGIDDRNDIAEAVMNRLRKAASEIRA